MLYQAFPNGMTLEEGVVRAEKWWNEKGREIITRMFEGEPTNEKHNEGYMSGAKFEDLPLKDQHKIVSTWYKTQGYKL